MCGKQFKSEDKLCAQCRRFWDEGPAVWQVYVSREYKALLGADWDKLNPRKVEGAFEKLCKNCTKAFVILPAQVRATEYCCAACCKDYWRKKRQEERTKA